MAPPLRVVTVIVAEAFVIGFFLLALALGYASGGKVASRYRETVSRNFLISAAIAGIGLAGISVDGMFSHLQPAWFAYLCFIGTILCPLAWLLGQTVPILTNLMQTERSGEASGVALYWSTLGSFLGSVTLSLLVMQWLGVSAAILACSGGLLVGGAIAAPLAAFATKHLPIRALLILVGVIIIVTSLRTILLAFL